MYPRLFATKNEHKISEANSILNSALEQISIDLFEPQGLHVEEVVSEKSEDAFRKVGEAVLVEDTGLEFAAWNGLPGALIKWFLDTVGNEGILKMLDQETNREAAAKTAVGFFDGKKHRVFTGEVSGSISDVARGTDGFGWDPLFIPEGHSKTFAEMSPDEKNACSMRKRALERMKMELQKTPPINP